MCCVGLVDEWRGPPGSGPNSTAGRCLQVKKKGRQRRWKPCLPGRGGSFPGPSAHPWVPHRGPRGFTKEEAQADVDAQLCGPPSPSRLPDGLRALGPWKKPGRLLPARLGRAAPHPFLMRRGGHCGRGFSRPPWTGQASAGHSPTSHTRGSTVLSTCVRWLGLPVRENHTMSSEPPPVTHQLMPRGPAEILTLLRDLGPHG